MIVQAPRWMCHPRSPPAGSPEARRRWRRDDATGRFERKDAPITFDSIIRSPRPKPLPLDNEIPDLLWPPRLPDRDPGRPVRKDALWRAVAAQTRSQARAILLVMHDLLANHRRVRLHTRGPGYLIERCARYYSAGGDLSHQEARAALDVVLHQLRATPITVAELNHHGIPVRTTRGRAHAQHWFLTPTACDDLAHVLGMLSAYGIRRPPSAKKMRALSDTEHHRDVTVRGQRWWALCPAHDDHNPSLLLNPDGSAFCFAGCGLVGRWTDRDRDGWATDGTEKRWITPSRASVRLFVDQEGTEATTKGSRPMARDHSAPWTGAAAEAPPATGNDQSGWMDVAGKPAQSPPLATGGFYVSAEAALEPDSTELGLRRYSRIRAAGAGSPGQHPARRVVGPEDGFDRYMRAPMMGVTAVSSRAVADPDGVLLYDLEARPWGIVLGKRGSRGMNRSYASSMDLLDVLKFADTRCRSDNAYARAVELYAKAAVDSQRSKLGASALDLFPDQFVSLDHMGHTSYRRGFNRVLPEKRDQSGNVTSPEQVQTISPPDGFEPAACRWVGVDVDDILIPWTAVEGESDACDAFPLADQRGIGSAGDAVLLAAAKAIQARVERHPLFTGRMGLVRTGPRGVQVVAELEVTRWAPGEAWRDPDFKAMVQNLSDRVLAELQAAGCDGGKVDPSAMAAGRYFRRPSWRVAKDRSLFRARLIFSSP